MIDSTQTGKPNAHTGENGSTNRDGKPRVADQGHRRRWEARRLALEADRLKHNRYGKRRKSRWSLFELLIKLFGIVIRFVNLYDRGLRNARNVGIHQVEAVFPDLPAAFRGYEILQLTDLHLDSIEDIADIICEQIRDVSCDLCVLTGDYREKTRGDFDQILKPLTQIIGAVHARDGILAVLGNHDAAEMASHFDGMGARLLANETITIHKGKDAIGITGIDDPHYYYTDQAVKALGTSGDGFKICLVHTSELYDIAAVEDYRLYLCGHTHGGQICLPGGIPVITHSYAGRRYSRGLWRFGRMIGYTSPGCGTVGIPIRFNCPSEIARIRLMGEKP